MGANRALEDVRVLSEILSKTSPDLINNIHTAISEFTKQRAADAKELVTISRNMDRPGKLGTMRFVIPLILDSTFHKIAPKIFEPGMFGMFQKEGVGFRQIQLRKLLDRVMQSVVILSFMTLVGTGLKFGVKTMARLLGVKDIVVGGGLALLVGVAGSFRRTLNSEMK